MKKLLYTLAGLSALALFASCNKEAERAASPEGEVVTATFTVAAPEGVATKAISDGTTATELIVAVYDETGKYLDDLSTHVAKTGAAPTWNVSMKVIKDMTYQFVFLAKKEAAVDDGFCHFDAANAKISIDYSAVPANSDAADFFFVQDRFKVENSFSKTEEMHRPLAQVNFGASDLAAAAYSIKTDNMKTGVTLKGIYSEMSVLTGEETGAAGNVTFTQADRVPTEDPKFVDGYDRIAMVYALVAKENQSNVTATLNVTAKGAKNDDNHPITREIANVPLKRNYRTNILGNIFTNDFNFTVNTVPGFYTSDSNKLIGPSFASVADLNAYFATFTDNADNGDVNPEVVTLTAFGTSEMSAATVALPKYKATPVRIRITAAYSGTLTLAYADADADKPATVELYAPNMSGATLTGTITSTHLTILEGSHIGTSTVSTSDTTLEIRPTATVGTVKIVKGNANIQGNVANVEVLSGATAVAETPVQVFVSKEAAIETITLNAKTDVVVEQPKDQITKDETERKVAVYVKEGAGNSTAKAQNGGVIYVKAEVPCTVTADGTSEAEEGNVSSTVIINENATGSAVVATNGGAIELTANGNCTASAEGQGSTSATPSTITITEAEAGVKVNTSTNDNGVINNTSGKDVVVMYAAKIGDTTYETLQEAFAAVPDDVETTIVLQNRYVIIGNDGIAISSKKNIILDLNGWLLSNAVNENRASQIFNIQGGSLTIRDSKGNGEIFNDVQKDTQPGDWWSTPQYNYATNVIKNSGTFILESGTIRQTAASSICYAVDNNSTSTDTETILRGGVLTSNGTTMRMFCNSDAKKNQLTIPENSTALLEGNYTSLWIQLPGSNSSSMKKAKLDIKGGTLKGNTYAFYDYSYGDGWDNVEYNITGGKFIGGIWTYKGYNTENPYKFLTGGYYSEDPSDYVADGYVSYFDDAAQVWKIKLEDVAQVGDVMYTSLVDAFEAAQAGDEVKMVKNMYIEATVPTPYGNKCGIKQDGEILNGQNYNLYLTTGGGQYTIMTSGGTIKNLTIASGFRAILLMYPQTDVYIDNVTSGPNVCYAINTAEGGNPNARIIATNSTFLGWCSFSLIASASFTNCKFGQGTYYTNTYGRLIKPYVTTTFTDCEFGYNCAEGDKYYLDLSAFLPGQTIKMINCKVGDTVITADNVADLLGGWDESNDNYSFDKSIFEIIQFE